MTEDCEIHWQRIKSCSEGGCDAGSDKYPDLTASITAISGYGFTARKSAKWMQGFCEGLMIQSGRA